MTRNKLCFGFAVSALLLLAAALWFAPPALMQGPIVLDGVAGAGEWDPSWQVTTDPLDVFRTDEGGHPHDPATFARSGYDATALWAHYDDTTAAWYFRLDVDGRVADSDGQWGADANNLGVGTHANDFGPLVLFPGEDGSGIGPSEVYRLLFQYQSGGPFSAAKLGDSSAILPGVVFPTTAGLAGQGVYSTTFSPGVLEWAFARDVIFPGGSDHGELWLAAQLGDSEDRVSDDSVAPVLLVGLDQSVGCPASPAVQGYQATFSTVYTVSTAAALGANGVTLTVGVPAGATFVGAGSGGTESGGLITWSLGDLSPGDTGQVTFTLDIDGATTSLALDSSVSCVEGLHPVSTTVCPVREPYHAYLPAVQNDYRPEPYAPDLVVDIAADGDGRPMVVVANEGPAR